MAPLLMIVPMSVVDVPLSKVTVLPLLIVGLFVVPSRVAVPLFWMAPPLEVVSVPPLIVLPLSSTIEPAPVAWIRPPVLVKEPIRASVPPLVASIVPVLVTVLVGATCSAPPLWLALMLPALLSVKAKPALLMPSWPAPWMALPASLIRVSEPVAKMRLFGLLDIASVPPPASSTVPLTCRSVKLPVEFAPAWQWA